MRQPHRCRLDLPHAAVLPLAWAPELAVTTFMQGRRDAKQRQEPTEPCLHPAQDRAQLQAAATQLVRAGASMEAADLEGRTALHLAAGCGDAAMVSHLLHLGADVNAVDSVGGETTASLECSPPSCGGTFADTCEAEPRDTKISWPLFPLSHRRARCLQPADAVEGWNPVWCKNSWHNVPWRMRSHQYPLRALVWECLSLHRHRDAPRGDVEPPGADGGPRADGLRPRRARRRNPGRHCRLRAVQPARQDIAAAGAPRASLHDH